MDSSLDEPRVRRPAGAAVLQTDVTEAIVSAAFEELASVGYGRLSLEAIAKRAHVGKTAIYRRWSSKQDLVVAIVSEVAVAAIDLPNGSTLREDLVEYLSEADRALRHPLAGAIIPDLLAEGARNEDLAHALLSQVRDPRRRKAAELISRAIGRGEVRADIDVELALDFIGGPLYWRLAVIRTPVAPDYFERLADSTIAALESM